MKNNKGFSLVELIVVIAIIAILSAALAPQLMGYVAKSRKSHDESNCKTIQEVVSMLLSEEEFHKIAAGNYAESGGKKIEEIEFFIHPDDEHYYGTVSCKNEEYKKEIIKLCNAIDEILVDLHSPKTVGFKSYHITIRLKATGAVGHRDTAYLVSGVDVELSTCGNKEAKAYLNSKGYK